jgi:hypothetical protein
MRASLWVRLLPVQALWVMIAKALRQPQLREFAATSKFGPRMPPSVGSGAH